MRRLFGGRPAWAAGRRAFSRATSIDAPRGTSIDMMPSQRTAEKEQREPTGDAPRRQHPPPLFDTHEVYEELGRSGFTAAQSETFIRVLDRTLRQSVQALQTEYLPRQTYNQDLMRQWAELDQMRRNILVIEKTEIYAIRSELEKMKAEMVSTRTSRERDLSKIENSSKLDNSLLKNQMFNDLQKMKDDIMADLDNMIEKAEHHQKSELKKEIAQVKLDAYRTIVALVITVVTLIITYLRFFPPWEGPAKQTAPAPPPPAQTDSACNTPVQTSTQYKLATTPVHLLKQAQLN